LDPGEGLEEVVEAAKALVSKVIDSPETERDDAGIQALSSAPKNLTKTPEVGHRTRSSALGKIPFILFLAAFSVWIVLLLGIYLPLVGWLPNTYPPEFDEGVLAAFQVSTVLASIISFYIGVGGISRWRKRSG